MSVDKVSSSSSDEKLQEVKHVDESLPPKRNELVNEDPDFTLEEQKKIIHRIDRRLIGSCGTLYCVSLMDRTNLSAAALAGMNAELKLNVGFRYSTIALVFFLTYVVFQPPATVLCRKIGPRPFLAGICLAWGAVMIGFGFPKSWTVMIPLRLLLGICEAGFFPGCVYLISCWYRRYDVGKRFSAFYLIGSLASALSGILAYGIMQMNGLAGFRGWRWIFIIEGILTCLLGIAGYWWLVDFPDKAHRTAFMFLNEKECNFVLRAINRDRDDAHVEPFNFKKWAASGADIKIWGFALIFFCCTTVTYAIAYFLPIILRENMGFSVGAAQCLVAPPYAFAGLLMLATAWLGDKYHFRGPILIGNALLGFIGLPLMGFHTNPGVRYLGVFLITGAANSSIPAAMAYQANNIRGQWKRAFCSATLVGMGGVGGIAGSLVFRSQDAPQYRPGVIAALVCQAVIIVVVVINTIYFRIQNGKADRGERVLEGSPEFRYTI